MRNSGSIFWKSLRDVVPEGTSQMHGLFLEGGYKIESDTKTEYEGF